ncbi:MAG TPA: glycine--tRNA ligase subunit beta [Candidatus Azoamicus sp. OHIO1]
MKKPVKKNKNLLIEIGTEELPAKELYNISLSFKENITNSLMENKITFSEVKNFASPRRISVLINNLLIKKEATIKKGPNVNIALNKDGTLTEIGKKFINQKKISFKKLSKEITKTDTWLTYKEKTSHRSIKKIIINIIETALNKLDTKKKMRWGSNKKSFIRPIHWIVTILGEKIIKFNYLNIKSNNYTYGHRFLANKKIIITPENYEHLLITDGYVIADIDKRKIEVINQIKIKSKELKSNIIFNDDLLNETTNIVEYPTTLIGIFKKKFLKVPKEIIISIVQKYQKCFPLIQNGKLINKFLIIINNSNTQSENIIKGYNFSINSRLYELTYLYETEKKLNIKNNTLKLKDIIFQEKLGSIYNKIERLLSLSEYFEKLIKKPMPHLKMAIKLSKTDLLTKIVTEMPELSGIIGSYYINEKKNIIKGIYEHNKPLNKYDNTPKSIIGISISILDKIDTISGFFFIGKDPTGNKDPYALRRSAFGIIKTIIENSISIDIEKIIDFSLVTYNIKNQHIKDKILKFVITRFKTICKSYNYDNKIFESIEIKTNIFNTFVKLKNLTEFFSYKNSNDIIILSKRIHKLINKNSYNQKLKIKKNIIASMTELNLLKKLKSHENIITKLYKNALYFEILKKSMELKKTISKYFDEVIILDKNKRIKENRLKILHKAYKQLNIITNTYLL